MLVDRVIIFAISFHPIFLMPCLHPIYLHKLALMMYKSIYWVKILSIVNIYTFACLFEILLCQFNLFYIGSCFNHIIICFLIWLYLQ
jgi:hypothetical protein